jgi:TolA-binding protein
MTPARGDLLVGMTRIHLQRSDYDAALQSAQSADVFWREFDPDNRAAAEAAFWLGRCYQALGRAVEAAREFSRARLKSATPGSTYPSATSLTPGR